MYLDIIWNVVEHRVLKDVKANLVQIKLELSYLDFFLDSTHDWSLLLKDAADITSKL